MIATSDDFVQFQIIHLVSWEQQHEFWPEIHLRNDDSKVSMRSSYLKSLSRLRQELTNRPLVEAEDAEEDGEEAWPSDFQIHASLQKGTSPSLPQISDAIYAFDIPWSTPMNRNFPEITPMDVSASWLKVPKERLETEAGNGDVPPSSSMAHLGGLLPLQSALSLIYIYILHIYIICLFYLFNI